MMQCSNSIHVTLSGIQSHILILNLVKNEKAFGTGGIGGSYAFADPGAQVGYVYVTNTHGAYPYDDPREKSIRDSMYHCIQRLD